MAIPRLFKVPGHRQFNYRPVYYDAQKEELKKRVEKIEKEVNASKKVDKKFTHSIQRGAMRGYFREVAATKRQSNIRLLIILFALFGLAYYIFYTQFAT